MFTRHDQGGEALPPPLPPAHELPDFAPALPWPSILGDASVSDIRFSGREFYEPELRVQAEGDTIALRIDDSYNPEAWCELVLTAQQCAELLARLVLLRRGDQTTTLTTLRSIANRPSKSKGSAADPAELADPAFITPTLPGME